MSQALPSDFAMRAILALLLDFQAHIRVKSFRAAQQTISCEGTALEDLRRELSALQIVSLADLETSGRRQSHLESHHSATVAELSAVQCDFLCLRSQFASANGFSLSETASVCFLGERTQRKSGFLASQVKLYHCERLRNLRWYLNDSREANIARLAVEVAALRDHSEGTQKHIAADEEKLRGLGGRDSRAAAGGYRRFQRLDKAAVADCRGFSPLFEEFRATHSNLLLRSTRDGFAARDSHHTVTAVGTDGNVFGGFTTVEWDGLMAKCGRAWRHSAVMEVRCSAKR
jgi:hypothetical protein